MSEFRTNRLAVVSSSLAMGVGAIAAEQATGIDPAHARAAESDNTPNLITEAVTKPTVFQYGASLVFKNGQLSVKSSEEISEDSSIAERPGISSQPLQSKSDLNKFNRLIKKCPYSANLNDRIPGGSKENTPHITASIVSGHEGKNTYKFRFIKARFCGMAIIMNDYSMKFPKPTKLTKKGGYYTDRVGYGGDKGVQSFIIFAKPNTKPKTK